MVFTELPTHRTLIWPVILHWSLSRVQTTPQSRVSGVGSRTSAARISTFTSPKAEMKAFSNRIIQSMCTLSSTLPSLSTNLSNVGFYSTGSGRPLSKASWTTSQSDGTRMSFGVSPTNSCHLECPQTSSRHIPNIMEGVVSPFLSPRMQWARCGKLLNSHGKLHYRGYLRSLMQLRGRCMRCWDFPCAQQRRHGTFSRRWRRLCVDTFI